MYLLRNYQCNMLAAFLVGREPIHTFQKYPITTIVYTYLTHRIVPKMCLKFRFLFLVEKYWFLPL